MQGRDLQRSVRLLRIIFVTDMWPLQGSRLRRVYLLSRQAEVWRTQQEEERLLGEEVSQHDPQSQP